MLFRISRRLPISLLLFLDIEDVEYEHPFLSREGGDPSVRIGSRADHRRDEKLKQETEKKEKVTRARSPKPE